MKAPLLTCCPQVTNRSSAPSESTHITALLVCVTDFHIKAWFPASWFRLLMLIAYLMYHVSLLGSSVRLVEHVNAGILTSLENNLMCGILPRADYPRAKGLSGKM